MRNYPKHNAANRAIQIPYDMPGRQEFLLRELKAYTGRTRTGDC